MTSSFVVGDTVSNDATAGEGEVRDPTSLYLVGPATASAIEEAPFTAADLRDGQVSVRALLEVGVNPGLAERLRRTYGLPWAYRWHDDGQQLVRRAAAMRDMPAAERRWIAESGTGTPSPVGSEEVEDQSTDLSELDWPDWPEPKGEDRGAAGVAAALDGGDRSSGGCPRCGGALSRYELDGRTSVRCEACGYVGVPIDHGGERAWRTAVDRLLRGERPPRRE